MHKYLMITSKAFIATLAYRSEVLVWIVIDAMPVIVMSIVWSAIYAGATSIRDVTYSEILIYYLLTLVISNTIDSTFEKERVQQIREGKLDFYFVRPLSYIGEIFFAAIGYRLFYLFACLPVIFSVFYLVSQNLQLTLPILTVETVSSFLLLILFGYLFHFLFGLITVISGFWLEGADGLEHFKWMLVSLFSGFLIPFEFMPDWLRTVSELLPFKYLFSIPINIILGKYSLNIYDIFILSLTLIFFCLIILLFYNQAKKTYSSNGG